MSYRHVFGPVISSRLERSLGLDLLARGDAKTKVCSFDCLYCEVGPNAERTLERRVLAPAGDILDELARWLEQHDAPLDHVTLGGSGEPCLHLQLGEIIEGVRNLAPQVPVAVLTNSSLLADPGLRRELALADVVLPSLDTLVAGEFQRLNRPHPALDLETMARSLLRFRQEFRGRLYLEVLLCAGVNDSEENLALLREFVPQLEPERVDVVTLSRPGAYAGSRSAAPRTLQRFREVLEPLAGAEAPGRKSQGSQEPGAVALRRSLGHEGEGRHVQTAESLTEEVYQSLRRRPQTSAQLATALNAPEAEVQAALGRLKREQRLMALAAASQAEPVFYKAI